MDNDSFNATNSSINDGNSTIIGNSTNVSVAEENPENVFDNESIKSHSTDQSVEDIVEEPHAPPDEVIGKLNPPRKIRWVDIKQTFQPVVRFFQVDPQIRAENENKERKKWATKLEFVLSCIGYSVGLGNVWWFPYKVFKHGGGAFLIAYAILFVALGIPMTFLEISLGQFSNTGVIKLWSFSPLFKGVGIAMVTITFFVCIYYNVIIAWCFYYLFASMQSVFPWSNCNNRWNTPSCLTTNRNLSDLRNITSKCNNVTTNCFTYQTAAEEYWENEVLGIKNAETGELFLGAIGIGPPQWHLTLCNLLVWIIVYLIVFRGISSSGKVVYITVFLPYVLLLVIIIGGAILPGSLNGIKHYLNPQVEYLGKFETWVAAGQQIFFSIGISLGGLQTLSSYNKFDNDIFRDALVIACVDTFTSLFAGFAVFATIGYLAQTTGLPIETVLKPTSGMVFVVFPESIATFENVPQFFSIVFFFMLIVIGIDSQFQLVLTVILSIETAIPGIGKEPKIRKVFTAVMCFVWFILGIPMCCRGGYKLFLMVSDYSAGVNVFIVGFLEIVAVCYVYDFRNFQKDIDLMLGKLKCRYFWIVCWVGISPLLLLVLIVVSCIDMQPVSYSKIKIPKYIDDCGLIIIICTLIPIPMWMIYKFLDLNKCKHFKEQARQTEEWCPELGEFRRKDERYKNIRENKNIV